MVNLEKLLAYHVAATESIRTVMALLNGTERVKKVKRSNGMIEQALAIEATRINGAGKKKKGKGTKKHTSNREQTERILHGLDLKVPATKEELIVMNGGKMPSIGVLIHHGYMKKKNGGYIRTKREFTV